MVAMRYQRLALFAALLGGTTPSPAWAAPEPPQAMELAPASQQPSPGDELKAMEGAAALPLGKSEGGPVVPALMATEVSPAMGWVCAGGLGAGSRRLGGGAPPPPRCAAAGRSGAIRRPRVASRQARRM